LAAQTPRLFNMTDLAWTALAAVGLILAVGLR
jgi:hypothetical protein